MAVVRTREGFYAIQLEGSKVTCETDEFGLVLYSSDPAVTDWCEKTFGPADDAKGNVVWRASSRMFFFAKEEHVVLCSLVWE